MTAPLALANLRDLGGLPTRGGGRTRTGVLLRSDAPYAGDVEGPEQPPGWPPASVVDLRGATEVERQPRHWTDATTVHRHELYPGARPGAIAPTDDLVDLYRSILRDAAERIVAVVDLLSDDGATLIHCAAGKDRTGIVVAVLLALAGVDDDSIVADYRLTDQAMPDVLARLVRVGALPGDFEDRRGWLRAPDEAIRVVLEEVHRPLGGAPAWFMGHGGNQAALESWVGRFVTPAGSSASRPDRAPGQVAVSSIPQPERRTSR